MASRTSSPWTLLVLLLLLRPPPGAHGESCRPFGEDSLIPESCPDFCCGSCSNQYCCSDALKKIQWNEEMCTEPESSTFSTHLEPLEPLGSALKFRSSYDSDPMSGFGATVAVGLTVFVVFIATIIICFTCSCCCLYKMCRPRPCRDQHHNYYRGSRPLPSASECGPQLPWTRVPGLPPHAPQPGMPAAPYPTQYPPPYLAQPTGPPAYHETLTGGPAAPYSASQPPYNPAYMDPQKAVP